MAEGQPTKFAIPVPGLGAIIALLVLILCVVAAFTSATIGPNVVLVLIGGVALARLLP